MRWPIRHLRASEGVKDVTPQNCRITCGPYAYMKKVFKGNNVTSDKIPPQANSRFFRYKWFCSRVYIIEDCVVGPDSITLGPNQDCYKTFRWGRNTRNAGDLTSERVSDYYPDYIHCFTFDPEKVFEATKSEWFDFSPFLCGGGNCYRKPQDENLADIFSEMKPTLPLLKNDKTFKGTLVFYYEAWAGHIAWRVRTPGASGPKPPYQYIRSTGEANRDYWLTVFFL